MGQTNFEKALLVASTAKQTQSHTHTLTNTTELYNKQRQLNTHTDWRGKIPDIQQLLLINTGRPQYSRYFYLRICLFTYEILVAKVKFPVKRCLFICEFNIRGPKQQDVTTTKNEAHSSTLFSVYAKLDLWKAVDFLSLRIGTYTVSFTDLDQGSKTIILESIFITFEASIIFRGSLGSRKNWLVLKIEPPLANFACLNW